MDGHSLSAIGLLQVGLAQMAASAYGYMRNIQDADLQNLYACAGVVGLGVAIMGLGGLAGR